MNLLELKQAIDFAVESCNRNHRDIDKITVYIPTYKVGSAGHIPCTAVKYANMGFDWEASSFLIRPEHELREIDRNEIATLRKKYEELTWTHYKVSKIKKENEDLKAQIAKLKGTTNE
jgi:hypothetical protein